MNKITVTVELGKEAMEMLEGLGKKLDAILELGAKPTPSKSCENAPQEAVEEAVEETPAEVVDTPPWEEKPAKKIELADIQQKVVALAAAGKKSQVREIINEYATRVSAIPADKAAEVWDKLTALEG